MVNGATFVRRCRGCRKAAQWKRSESLSSCGSHPRPWDAGALNEEDRPFPFATYGFAVREAVRGSTTAAAGARRPRPKRSLGDDDHRLQDRDAERLGADRHRATAHAAPMAGVDRKHRPAPGPHDYFRYRARELQDAHRHVVREEERDSVESVESRTSSATTQQERAKVPLQIRLVFHGESLTDEHRTRPPRRWRSVRFTS